MVVTSSVSSSSSRVSVSAEAGLDGVGAAADDEVTLVLAAVMTSSVGNNKAVPAYHRPHLGCQGSDIVVLSGVDGLVLNGSGVGAGAGDVRGSRIGSKSGRYRCRRRAVGRWGSSRNDVVVGDNILDDGIDRVNSPRVLEQSEC